jgi:hypothetical protein
MPVPCRAGRRPLRHIAAVILQAAVAEFSLGRKMLPFCCMLIPNSRDMFRHAAVKIDHTILLTQNNVIVSSRRRQAAARFGAATNR